MEKLSAEKCEACHTGAPLLSDKELKMLLPQIPEWQLKQSSNVPTLVRDYRFDNFVLALAFANKVGELAELENHHPAITIEWGKVSVQWWTHKINGLHRNDVVMAAKTDALFISND